ncbi:MAG TPA: 50S ribosomal protein L4 [Bacteroidetes bacterium]|nr:50S ribosomal protein L4 [Bacteroidota bacterium]
MEITVKNKEGADTGRKVTLSESIFGVEPSDHAIYEDVRLILANARQGTHKAKERGEVSGSKKKPYRQKGTGNARPGSKRSPLWRHGGRVFGPKPRDYGFRLNKKVKRLARRSALTYKAREERIMVLENFQMESPKTKDFLSLMAALKLDTSKVLLVLSEDSKNIYLSGRNLPKTQVIRAEDLNTYDILNAESLVIVEDAVAKIEKQLG